MYIPDWPEKRQLCIEDKDGFDTLLLTLQPQISEFTFAGLYLFRNVHQYEISHAGNCLIIIGKGYDCLPYAMVPIGDDSEAIMELLVNSGYTVFGADQQFISNLKNPEKYCFREDRDSFDYLYLRDELANLPGNRYHKKKNRINYCTTRHNYTTDLYSSKYMDGCLQLLDRLSEAIKKAGVSFLLEQEACREGVIMADKLGLEGVVILIDDKVQAFALGERLSKTTCVCHFEKGDHFLDGIMQLVNREFCRLLFSDCCYVNREQDLGEAGLRNAKLSYHPIELVKKYRITGITSDK